MTVEFKINLPAPSRGERLSTLGEVLKTGRTAIACEKSVSVWAGDRSMLCAAGRQTLIQVHQPGSA